MVTEAKNPDVLLTVSQVAERLHLNPYTVREMLRNHELRGFKFRSTRWRVRESDLVAFMRTGPNKKPK